MNTSQPETTRRSFSNRKRAIFAAFCIITAACTFIMLFVFRPKVPWGTGQIAARRVTIWVHGTRGSELLPVGISKRVSKVEHEICFCPSGLHKSSSIDPEYHLHTIAKVLNESCPEEFPLESFYLFGWSGALSFPERKSASLKLMQEIKNIIHAYTQSDGAQPNITIITHSHGGNVALNMAQLIPSNELPPFCIDRLILLACPVQKETSELIDSELFQCIYSLHSHMDTLQILDPQGWHALVDCSAQAWNEWSLEPIKELFFGAKNRPMFSERHFKNNERLTQARIRWEDTHPWGDEDVAIFSEFRTVLEGIIMPYLTTQRDLLHVEFILPSFLRKLPHILNQLQNTNHSSKNMSDEYEQTVYV